MNAPLVTIYITNYNYGQFIKKAIDSVLNQTFQDFELVIIDDGSSDDSKEIIESYSTLPQVSIIYQQNKGLNVTNNVALRVAKGTFIMRLDADDFLVPTAVEKMTALLQSNNDLGLVFPDYYYADEEGAIIGEEKRHDFDTEVTLYDQPAHGACTLIRRENLLFVGGYNESYNCQDGYELWVKFIQHFKVSNIAEPLFYYRQHGSNLTKNENRILETRAKINASYIEKNKHHTDTLAIIPVRGGSGDAAFIKLGSQTLLERKIRVAESSNHIKQIVVTSPDRTVEQIIKSSFSDKQVLFHHRDQHMARLNTNLNPVIADILKMSDLSRNSFQAVALLMVEYPFITATKIDDAINTMLLFGSDSLIGVRSDNSVFYQHHGDGLHPILNRDKYTKLEREALFKQVGGINVVKKSIFDQKNEVITGKIGHMVIDQITSLGIFSDFDLTIANHVLSGQSLAT
ncbi:MAG: glycosyltransferase involved in cell wall biosynthesis [Cyclobacteriaceae bacterium]|jgi:glycosyltransferase involved in cell wall biosynthesis